MALRSIGNIGYFQKFHLQSKHLGKPPSPTYHVKNSKATTLLLQDFTYEHTTSYPFLWFNISMGAFIEQEITEARMLIDDMIKESLELCQNNSPTAIEGRGGIPMEVPFTWLYPLR